VGGVFEVLLLLASDPALSDYERFPPRSSATAALEFNRAYREHVVCRQSVELHHWWDWEDTLSETDYLYHCWAALATAQGADGDSEESRRAGLRRLRELLGDEAYYQGAMPPSVPVWRFWSLN
jgi:hypothetical protein